MRQVIITLTLFVVSASTGHLHAQCHESLADFERTVYYHLENNGVGRHINDPQRKTKQEAFLVILETDSTGSIASVNFLADPKNTDTAYAVLNRLTVADFSAKSKTCTNHTIVIPVFSSLPDEEGPTYVSKILRSGLFRNTIKTPNVSLLRPIAMGWMISKE